MNKIEKKLSINAPKAQVWDVISDLGGIQNYNPGVKKSYYNTDIKSGEGAGRVCEFYPMGKVDEKAIQWEDGDNYTLHIKPLEKLPFFKEGKAHFSLTSNGNSNTQVHVEFLYDTTSGSLGWMMNKLMLRNNFDKGFEGILLGLKKHIEEGAIIENNASLKGYQVSFA